MHRPELLADVERVGGRVHVLLERVDAQVDRTGHGGSHRLAGEPVVLDLEVNLPVAVTEREELVLAVVEELVA